MTNARRMNVAYLRSDSELRSEMGRMQANRPRAEAFVRDTFGPHVFNDMVSIRNSITGSRPTFALLRQLAKPDMEFISIYVGAARLGYSMMTMEWSDDYMVMNRDNCKRSYLELPLIGVGRAGLYARNMEVAKFMATVGTVVREDNRICNIPVLGERIAELNKVAANMTKGAVNLDLEASDCMLPEFYKRLRYSMKLDNQTVCDVGELAKMAALNVVAKRIDVPGKEGIVFSPRKQIPKVQEELYAREIADRFSGFGIGIDSVGGEFMNLLTFSMQNMIPNILLVFKDWNNDGEKIQNRYISVNSFLESKGLSAPLQTCIPSIHTKLPGMISGSTVPIDMMVPLTTKIGMMAGEPSGDFESNFVESCRSVMEMVKLARG